jgi:hypothetical protein
MVIITKSIAESLKDHKDDFKSHEIEDKINFNVQTKRLDSIQNFQSKVIGGFMVLSIMLEIIFGLHK